MPHCCCTLTDVLFSVIVQCVVAALSSFLLPLNTAIFRNGLPRAPHLGRPPWTLLGRKEASTERSRLQNNPSGFLIPLCQDFSEKGNEDLSVPGFTSPSETGMVREGKWIRCACWRSASFPREGKQALRPGTRWLKVMLARSPGHS